LEIFGFKINHYDHQVTYDGLPTKKKLEMLSKEKNFPEKLHQLTNDMKQQFTIDMVNLNCKPTFYHEYALSKFKKEGYQIAVCSNSIRSTVTLMMEKSGLSKYLNFYLSNEDVKKAKPDPEIYTKAIEKLGLSPSECLIIEDNEHGLQAATASGAHILKVANPNGVTYDTIKTRIKEIESE
ncbi:MAG: HAD family hydrolase, partial [Mangrovicoccus sp.]